MILQKVNLPLDLNDIYWTENWENLRNYILLNLGYPILRVELTEKHLNIAIRNAVKEYINYEALDIYCFYSMVDEEGYVIVPPEINLEIGLVHDVIFETSNIYGFLGSTIAVDYPFFGINQPFRLADFDLIYYWQQRSKLEDMNQLLNSQRTWDIENGKIKVYPHLKNMLSRKVAVLYCPIPKPEILEQDSWIQAMSLAESKILLGIIRRKFSSYTFGGGGTNVDGNEMTAEGKEEKEKLLEEIKNRRRPLPMIQF